MDLIRTVVVFDAADLPRESAFREPGVTGGNPLQPMRCLRSRTVRSLAVRSGASPSSAFGQVRESVQRFPKLLPRGCPGA